MQFVRIWCSNGGVGGSEKGLQGVCLVGRMGGVGWWGVGSLHGAAPSRGWLPRGGGSLERACNPICFWLLTSVPTLISLCKRFSCKACPGTLFMQDISGNSKETCRTVFSIRWKARGRCASWPDRHDGVSSYPVRPLSPPRRTPSPPARPAVCSGVGFNNLF